MDNPVFIILLFLFISIPVLLILANLDRMRKRDTEMRVSFIRKPTVY